LIILVLSPFDQRERHCQVMGRVATLMSNATLQYSIQIPQTPEALFQVLEF
jgi:hypothetical protein